MSQSEEHSGATRGSDHHLSRFPVDLTAAVVLVILALATVWSGEYLGAMPALHAKWYLGAVAPLGTLGLAVRRIIQVCRASGRDGRTRAVIEALALYAVAFAGLTAISLSSLAGVARRTGRQAVCEHNMKRLEVALSAYAETHPRPPAIRAWSDEARLGTASDAVFVCLNDKLTEYRVGDSHTTPGCSYALNSSLINLMSTEVRAPERVVSLFESDAGWNAAGGPELLPDEPRHLGGDNYGFADGHVEWLSRKKLPDGTWAKEPEADWVIWERVLREDEGEENR